MPTATELALAAAAIVAPPVTVAQSADPYNRRTRGDAYASPVVYDRERRPIEIQPLDRDQVKTLRAATLEGGRKKRRFRMDMLDTRSLTPEQAADIVRYVTGAPVCTGAMIEKYLRGRKRSYRANEPIADTVSDFERSVFRQQPTTDRYKLIVGCNLGER